MAYPCDWTYCLHVSSLGCANLPLMAVAEHNSVAFVVLIAAIVVVMGVVVVGMASVVQLFACQYLISFCFKISKYFQSRTLASVLQKFGDVARISQYWPFGHVMSSAVDGADVPKQSWNDVGVVQAKRLSALHTLHEVVAVVVEQSAVAFPVIQTAAESVQTVPDGQVRMSALITPPKQAIKDVSVTQATPDREPHDKQTPFVE